MSNKIFKLMIVSALSFQLTACPTGGQGSVEALQGLPGKDVTEIADGTIELSKLKVSASDIGKVLTVENGAVLPKDASAGDPAGTILFKNAAGVIVAKSSPLAPMVGINGHLFYSRHLPQYLQAFGVTTEQNVRTLYLTFSGSGCTGEARFTIGDSSNLPTGSLIAPIKSFAAGLSGTFYEVDFTAGVRTDPFVAMSHANAPANICTETTVGGVTHNTSLMALPYPTNPIAELGIVSAEVK